MKVRGIPEIREFWPQKGPLGPDLVVFGVQKSRFLKNLENGGDSSKIFVDIKVAHFDPGIGPLP